MGGDKADLLVLVVVIGARLIVPLLIPRFPLPAIITALVIDAADQTIFQQLTDLNLDGYQSYDKALDIYYLTIAYLSVIRNWTNGYAAEVARFLWYFRLVGVVLFEFTEQRWLLLVFPNTFEYFFIAYEVVRLGWDPRRMSRRAVLGLAAFIWVVIKLPQEWWIHVAQLDFTEFVQEKVFGVEPGSWGDAFSNRPWVLVLLAAAIAALVWLAVRESRRLPSKDWPLTVSSDHPAEATLMSGTEPGPELRWPVTEKIVLISLLVAVFTQVLNVDAGALQIVAGTTLVVVANVGFSHLLARGGYEWRRIGIEFALLAVVNTALIAAYARVVGEQQMNRAAAWFFGALLTLVVLLYDRYRGLRMARTRHTVTQ